jgi:chitodextrinase
MFLSRYSVLTRFGLCLSAILTLSGGFPSRAQTPPPVPPSFQDLYTSLDNYLNSFNTTLNSQWNGVKYPVIFSAQLWDASANAGPALISPTALTAVQNELQELKAMGVQGVEVEVDFPMLYEPFFSSQSQYQQYVTFYQGVAASVRAQGMKLIVSSTCMWNSTHVLSGWPTIGTFYASLDWAQYQQARAQTAAVIAQTMHPDYMSVLEEPDTEATMSGQSEVNTVAGATSMLSQILNALQAADVPNMQVGAGVGSWLTNFQQFIQSFVTLPVDFIDMHVLPVNDSYLPNALTIASIAASAGKPVTMTQIWLRKVRDDELTTLTDSQLMARDAFSFWAPLDAYFLETMQKMAYFTKMSFISACETIYFWAYLPYDSATENLTPAQIMNEAVQQSSTNMLAASFTSTALSYYSSILPAPDTTPPSTPSGLAGVSGQPTMATLSWDASTDNVGVAGYHLFRNGVKIATTAQTFYQDTGLTDGTMYSYAVNAFDLAGNVSAPSLTVPVTTWNSIPPTAPTNLVATAVSCQQINLTWTASTDKIAISSYLVFRGTSANNLTQVATTYSTPTSYTNYPLTASTTYYFGVEAVDTDGNVSPMSAVVPATTMALPSPPTNLVAKPVSSEEIGLTWSPGPSGTPVGAYYIFRGTSRSNLTQVATRTTTAFNDYPLTPGTTYYYAVEEASQGNVSPMSAIVSATTLAGP